ncbi:FAD/NAD(P)-binding protein [Yersinia enterocolitica]|uniref:FAD/NAD(P)-binding protein n=1 Tax=Yersinia enterocolitica TaxID=630 RepID=UPI0005DD569C|nr:FAD/NAD(P)-binding protein [Yersinia enterocolitica]EKN3829653.1 FAD/NAD(P)-binding protein [Yersinia enterocolitica]EKN3953334.1 FAD/NAD(P)-binding protein [Yersinia enterocolitica]EKN3954425.1 FAD/NAD(P)-binding protein [Yersinia enterocolitica]EKN3997373.1 FAD/NAD(P)-binding protein [Yersinia enterocolitica]EKN4045185.1 FAD/NAD(P)-binding protein [Yersinia enterocolitica]
MSSKKRSIAIIGGGVAGVATFIAAVLRHATQLIYIIEPSPIGPGMAFSNVDEDVLCNTSVDTMSILADKPLDFYDYLIASGHVVTTESFVPRKWVGNYLADRFREYFAIAHRDGIVVIHIPHLFISLKINAPRCYSVMFGDVLKPQSLVVTDVVFCTGYGCSRIPDAFSLCLSHPTFIRSPYPEMHMLARIPAHSRVLVIGSKLSAIDTAILLCRESHQVTMISPSGSIPAVRTYLMRCTDDAIIDQDRLASIIMMLRERRSTMPTVDSLKYSYIKYFVGLLKKHTNESWRDQFSFVRNYRDRLYEEISIAEKGKCQWQDITVNFLNVMNEIHLANTSYFVGSFHPDFMKIIHRYLSSIPLINARKILQYIDNGVLFVQKGEIGDISISARSPDVWRIDWGEGDKHFDAIVCATGYCLPYYFFDSKGHIVIDIHSEHAKDAILISSSLGISHPYFKEIESIWFVGIPAHTRLWIVNAFFVVLALANQTVDNIMRLPERIN